MKLQLTLDKSAISLSLLCMAHCLILPSLLILLPAVLAVPLGDELFHKALLICVIPLSAIALFLGCRKHKSWNILSWGLLGLAVLIFAGFFGHDLVGETGEKLATIVGSLFIILSHYKNYRLCSNHKKCEC